MISYLYNDKLLLLEVEEYGKELVAQAAILTPFYMQQQVLTNDKLKLTHTIIVPREFLGKAQVLIYDIPFELCPITSPKSQRKQ
jgi:hypothetical protein